MSFRTSRRLLALLLLCLLSASVTAQPTEAERNKEELERIQRQYNLEIEVLKQQNALEQAKLELETAKSSMLQLQFPQGTSAGINGTAAVNGSYTLIYDIQVTRACNNVTWQLAKNCGAKGLDEVVFSFDPDLLKKLDVAQKLVVQTQEFTLGEADLDKPPTQESLLAGLTILKSVLSNGQDISKFFQHQTTLIPGASNVTNSVPAALMFGNFQKEGITTYNYDLGEVPFLGAKNITTGTNTTLANQDLTEALDTLQTTLAESQKKQKAKEEQLSDLKEQTADLDSENKKLEKKLLKATDQAVIAKLTKQIKDNKGKLKDLKDKTGPVEKSVAARKKWEADAAAVLAALRKPPGDSGALSIEHQTNRSRTLYQALLAKETRGLAILKLESVGGSTRVVQHVFNSGSYSFSGGAVLSFHVLTSDKTLADQLRMKTAGVFFDHCGWGNVKDDEKDIPISSDGQP